MLTVTPPESKPQDASNEVPGVPVEGGLPPPGANVAVATPGAAVVDPDDLVSTEKTPTLVDRVQAFRARYEKQEMALFFFAGFLYDVLTLSPVDDALTGVQNFVYLAILAGLLVLEQRYPEGAEPPKLLAKVWRFREDALHFFLGSLLSAFTLFLFKSSSGFTPLLFMAGMFGLLVANELPRFRQLGPVIRVAVFSLCVTLYFASLLPVLFGRVGWWIFTLSVVLGCGSIYGLLRVLKRWRPDEKALLRTVAIPGFGAQAMLLACYFLGVIPPVPLAVQYSGIYHQVKRVSPGVYHLTSEAQPWWKVWTAFHHGDQDFMVRPGEQPVYFFRIFAPKGFEPYRVRVRWFHDHPEKGWTALGKGFLASVSSNGSEGGYRYYAQPGTTPKPGDWRVVLETEDGHEINRLSFTVTEDTRTEPREEKVDVSVLKVTKPLPLEDWQKLQPPAPVPAPAAATAPAP
ncbi:DUF2914 domain-containing protein [Corallococcus sp. AB049A]|uniref:DUF2914 domain-containing protein n=1 Tax=Corallococcus interemptor TaxID=2316720 RepID=A0A3A8QI34_9BACT|nr:MULTISPECIES: DUF2914 domain-containing protein [Corallococcus]RKH65985.1 DUF2914 domain-containing protein [Corallococcus interemptor]RKI67558.1 DUF2914 domain-containing protein [Corallococcus sp. AB049A]